MRPPAEVQYTHLVDDAAHRPSPLDLLPKGSPCSIFMQPLQFEMRVRCMYCGASMGTKPCTAAMKDEVTSGICDGCKPTAAVHMGVDHNPLTCADPACSCRITFDAAIAEVAARQEAKHG